MPELDPHSLLALPHLLGGRAMRHGDRQAVTYLDESETEVSWTYRELWLRSCRVARQLEAMGVKQPAPRALLLYPPGIDFLAGFLGCQIAGWVPVPTCYPKPGREMPRLDAAAMDCSPSVILGDENAIRGLDPSKLCEAASSLPTLVAAEPTHGDDDDFSNDLSDDFIDPQTLSIAPDAIALLQYTSGSTSDPKGVMVRHRNLMSNLESIRRGFHVNLQSDDATEVDCGVFWLPFFHDMGLIGGILEPLYVGGTSILMSPRAFLQRPLRWLQTISDKRAVISGAPNFAYQLCVDRISPDQTDDLDLAHWRIAFTGAEPILPRTLHDFAARFSACGFSGKAFYPCYGLAEATLMAAGGDGPGEPKLLTVDRESLSNGKPEIVPESRGPKIQKLVSCGPPVHQTEVVLVDSETCHEVPSGQVGEIWLRGNGVTSGYWNRDEENASQFHATTTDGRTGFCRTGDLGFMHDGELYVTGRIKDVVILRGRNLFPQDIEATVRETVGAGAGQCAAFSVDAVRGEALAIIAELPRRRDQSGLEELIRAIRRSVIEVHEVDPRHVLLTRQATVPLTSSGKVQRSRCRELFDAGQIKTKHRYERASGSAQVPLDMPHVPPSPTEADRDSLRQTTESWMTTWLVARAGVAPSEIDLEKPFADYGLDSMTAVEMSGEIEDWSGARLTPIVAWNYPTVTRLSEYIVDQIMGAASPPPNQLQESEVETNPSENESQDVADLDLEGLLDEIENLSEDEIQHALTDKRQP